MDHVHVEFKNSLTGGIICTHQFLTHSSSPTWEDFRSVVASELKLSTVAVEFVQEVNFEDFLAEAAATFTIDVVVREISRALVCEAQGMDGATSQSRCDDAKCSDKFEVCAP